MERIKVGVSFSLPLKSMSRSSEIPEGVHPLEPHSPSHPGTLLFIGFPSYCFSKEMREKHQYFIRDELGIEFC